MSKTPSYKSLSPASLEAEAALLAIEQAVIEATADDRPAEATEAALEALQAQRLALVDTLDDIHYSGHPYA